MGNSGPVETGEEIPGGHEVVGIDQAGTMGKHADDSSGIDALMQVSIDTVERYQGSQRDVIIYSFTIQNRYQLEFLTANCFVEDGKVIDRKLNVVLTRARKQLILTGNEEVLRFNRLYALLLDDIKKRGGYA